MMKKLLLPFIFLSGFMAVSLPACSATTELKTSSANFKNATSSMKGTYLVTLERRDPTTKSASVAAFTVAVDKNKTETITAGVNGNNWDISITEHADGYSVEVQSNISTTEHTNGHSVEVQSNGAAQARIPQVNFGNKTQFSLDGTDFKVSRKAVGDKPIAIRISFWDHNQKEWKEAATL